MGSEHEREASAFGRALAIRARPQLAMATPATAHRTIGRIARITTGFGRAVGRSTSVRPVVRRSDLNSTTLRPPPGSWMRPSGDDVPSVAPHETLGTTHRANDTASMRRSFEPRPHPSRHTVTSPSRPMSWTDRLVNDSRAAAAPAAHPAAEITAAPAPRLSPIEELQAMMDAGTLPHQVQGQRGQRDSTTIRRSSDRDSTPQRASSRPGAAPDAPNATGETDAHPAADGEEMSGLGRGDTKAGARTGPGILSRSLMPERGEHTPTPPTARRRRRRADLEPSTGTGTSATGTRAERPIPDLTPGPAPSPGGGTRVESGTQRRAGDPSARVPDASRRSTPSADRSATASPTPETRRGDPRSDAAPGATISADEMIRRDFADTAAPADQRTDRPSAVGAPPVDAPSPDPRHPEPGNVDLGNVNPGTPGRSATSIGDASAGRPNAPTAPRPGAAAVPLGAVRPIMPSLPGDPLAGVPRAPATGDAASGDGSLTQTITQAPVGSIAVLRRVTLPRATSTMHRPPSTLRRFHRTGSRDTIARIADNPSMPPRSPAPAAVGAGAEIGDLEGSAQVAQRTVVGPKTSGTSPRSAPDGLVEPPTTDSSATSSPATGSPTASWSPIDRPTTDSARGEADSDVSPRRDPAVPDSPSHESVSREPLSRDPVSRESTVSEPTRQPATPTTTSQWSPPRDLDGLAVRPDGAPRTTPNESTHIEGRRSQAGTPQRDAGALPRVSVLRSDEIVRRTPAPTAAPGRTSDPSSPSRPSLSRGAALWTPSTPSRTAAFVRGPGALLEVIRRAVRRSDTDHPAPPVVSRDRLATTAVETAVPTSRRSDPAAAPLARPASTTTTTTTTESGPAAAPGPDSAPDADALAVAPPTPDSSPSPTPREARHDASDPSVTAAAQPVAPTIPPVPDTPAPPEAARRTAPRSAASDDLNQRFMAALSERIQRRPAPLPTVFQPMAEVIAPGRRVMLSTDDTSRRALRSVGKVAATVDDVIHLDAPSPVTLAIRPDPKIDEIVAHELAHTAHPSPVPRFFDDVDDSPEERTAEAVARIMATSSLAPSASVAPAPTIAQRSRPDHVGSPSTIRRSMTGSTMPDSPRRSPRPDTAPGFVSAASLAARAAGSAPTGNETIRRSVDTAATSQTSERVQRRANTSASASFAADTTSSGGDEQSGDPSDEWFVVQLERNMDLITRRLEERMIVEFERRGGRMWGGL